MEFNIKVLDEGLIPSKAHETDAGFDLRAFSFSNIYNEKLYIIQSNSYELNPGDRVFIDTGVAIELKPGWEAQIRPRSGLALKYGLTIVNSPGTIDADYRNNIGVILYNSGKEKYVLRKYDRIAQLIIKEVPKVDLVVVSELNTTDRNLNGFGSTGNK